MSETDEPASIEEMLLQFPPPWRVHLSYFGGAELQVQDAHQRIVCIVRGPCPFYAAHLLVQAANKGVEAPAEVA